MLMDIRVYRMEPGRKRDFCRRGEETAVLLLSGTVTFGWEGLDGDGQPQRRVH